MIGGPARPALRRWRRVPTLAALSGLGVAASEIASLSGERIGGADLLQFLSTAWVQWSAAGLLIAAFAEFAVPRWRPATSLALSAAVMAPIAALVSFHLARALGDLRTAADLRAPLAYVWWVCTFYGLLLVVTRLGVERVERTRRLLATAELARSRAESDAAAAQLDALRGQVDPALMLRAMVEVQRRYTRDPLQADRLLDAFVAFLRAAMPAVRSGASTLAAELALLQAYAALSAQLDPDRSALGLQIDGHPAELAFPPLALLPVVEALTRAAAAAPRVVATCSATCTTLALHAPAPPGWLDAATLYRVRVALRSTGAADWRLDIRNAAEEGDACFVLQYVAGAHAPHPEPAAPGPGASSPTGEPPWTTPDWTAPTAAT